ncbi:hypothetical protein [Halarcobacter sp.]|uniref:hypothetical protein n=1 Tax=Halarcobacter sp. TaxID=2321133 RepID=UPI003A9006FD
MIFTTTDLFIASGLSILFAIGIYPIGLKIIKKKVILENYDRLLSTLWICGFMFFVLSVMQLFGNIKIVNQYNNGLWASLGIILSAFIASASVMKNVANANRIEKEKSESEESEFFLNKSISELNNVYELLKDKNNDRITWILAARVLNMSLELSKKIKKDSHKEYYHLQEFQLKNKLLDLFKEEEYSKLEFYAGVDNPLNSNKALAIDYISDYLLDSRKIKCLDEASLIAIFSFVEFSEDFNDPIDDNKVPNTLEEFNRWIKKGSIRTIKAPLKTYFEYTQYKDREEIINEKYKNATF